MMSKIVKIMKLVNGDLLNNDSNLIIHQLNCLCVKPHGLSATIANKYPYANVYGTRTSMFGRNLAIPKDRPRPGMVCLSKPPNGVNGPIVAGIFGQYDFGKSYYKNNRPSFNNETETSYLREQWFQNGLNLLRDWLINSGNNKSEFKIGIPYKIGCGLAGGKWNNYYTMLQDFASNINCEVTLYKI